VVYDALAESVRLIEDGPPEPAKARLSRRVRHVPLAVDVDGPIAVTLFARRGPGRVAYEQHVLVRRDGMWSTVGGGGWTTDEALDDAPAAADLGGHLDLSGGGTLHVGGGPGLPGVVRYAVVRAAREVATVLVADRPVPVPPHGWLVAVWPDGRSPGLTALDATGAVLATVDPGPRCVRMPEVYPG
jgi:hypothetical protein